MTSTMHTHSNVGQAPPPAVSPALHPHVDQPHVGQAPPPALPTHVAQPPKPPRTTPWRLLPLLILLLATACGEQVPGWPGVAVDQDRAYVLVPGSKLLALNLDARSRAVATGRQPDFPAEGEWQYPAANDQRLGGAYSTPVLAAGTLYFTTYQAGGLFGKLYAIDAANGQVRWDFEPTGTANAIVATPTIVDGTVYFGSSDHRIYAIDAAGGAKKWEFATQNKVWAGVQVQGATVYAASLDHRVYALDKATGRRLWDFGAGGPIASTPAYDRGTLYTGSAGGSLYAIDATTGQQKWRFEAGSWLWGTPLIQDSVIYAGSLGKQVFAVDAASGQQKWVFDAFGPVSATPVLAGGILAVADQSGRVYGLDPASGIRLWDYVTDPQTPIHGGLAAGTDGKLYMMSLNRKLVALNAASGRPEWTCPTGGDQVCR